MAAALARRAAIEPDLEVRSQLACSARRLPAPDALPIVRALLRAARTPATSTCRSCSGGRSRPRRGPTPRRCSRCSRIARSGAPPIVRGTVAERLMRRFAAAGTRADLDRCTRLLAMAPAKDDVKRLMAGFEAAYAGRSLAGLPTDLAEAVAKYAGQSLTIGLRQGKPEAMAEALRLLGDDHADRSKRVQVLQVLGEVRRPAAVPVVLRLACHSPDNALRAAALAALAALRRPDDRRRGARRVSQHVGRCPGGRAGPAGLATDVGRAVPRGHRGPVDRFADRPPRGRRQAPRAGRCAGRGTGIEGVRARPALDIRTSCAPRWIAWPRW